MSKIPSIQRELNQFLLENSHSSETIANILELSSNYLQFFSSKASGLLHNSITYFKEDTSHLSINLLHQACEEIEFEIEHLEEIYTTSYIEFPDILNCFPLIHLILDEIILTVYKSHY